MVVNQRNVVQQQVMTGIPKKKSVVVPVKNMLKNLVDAVTKSLTVNALTAIAMDSVTLGQMVKADFYLVLIHELFPANSVLGERLVIVARMPLGWEMEPRVCAE